MDTASALEAPESAARFSSPALCAALPGKAGPPHTTLKPRFPRQGMRLVNYLELLQLVGLIELGGQRLSQEGVQLLATQDPRSRPLHHIPTAGGQRGSGVRREGSPVTRTTWHPGSKGTQDDTSWGPESSQCTLDDTSYERV